MQVLHLIKNLNKPNINNINKQTNEHEKLKKSWKWYFWNNHVYFCTVVHSNMTDNDANENTLKRKSLQISRFFFSKSVDVFISLKKIHEYFFLNSTQYNCTSIINIIF